MMRAYVLAAQSHKEDIDVVYILTHRTGQALQLTLLY